MQAPKLYENHRLAVLQWDTSIRGFKYETVGLSIKSFILCISKAIPNTARMKYRTTRLEIRLDWTKKKKKNTVTNTLKKDIKFPTFSSVVNNFPSYFFLRSAFLISNHKQISGVVDFSFFSFSFCPTRELVFISFILFFFLYPVFNTWSCTFPLHPVPVGFFFSKRSLVFFPSFCSSNFFFRHVVLYLSFIFFLLSIFSSTRGLVFFFQCFHLSYCFLEFFFFCFSVVVSCSYFSSFFFFFFIYFSLPLSLLRTNGFLNYISSDYLYISHFFLLGPILSHLLRPVFFSSLFFLSFFPSFFFLFFFLSFLLSFLFVILLCFLITFFLFHLLFRLSFPVFSLLSVFLPLFF